MKIPRITKLLLLLAHCVPYAFLCLYGDAMYGTMLFYTVTIVCLSLLSRLAVRTKNLPLLFFGSLLSFLSSSAAAKFTNLKIMDYYFKPFTTYSLMVTISLAALFLQILFILSIRKKYAGS